MTGTKNSIVNIVLSLCFMLLLTTAAFAASEHIPDKGDYIIGEQSEASASEDDPAHVKAGTNFYVYIENPTQPIFPSTPSPKPSDPVESESPEPSSPPSEPSGPPAPSSPALPSFPPYDPTPGLPKTGDAGLDATMLMVIALVFGFVYLLCDFYAKKKHA